MFTVHVVKMTHSNEQLVKAYHSKGTSSNVADSHLYEGIALSQYETLKKVLELLKRNPHMPVIADNQPCQLSSESLRASIIKLFPVGLPDQFQDLTVEQKEYITNYGMAGYLLGADIIPILYSDNMQLSNSQFAQQQIASEVGDFLMQHEYLALRRGIDAARDKGVKEAIIVYGRIHDFDLEDCFKGSVRIVTYETLGLLQHPSWQKMIADLKETYQQRSFTNVNKCKKLRDNKHLLDTVVPEPSLKNVACYPATLPFPVAPTPVQIENAPFVPPQPVGTGIEIHQRSDALALSVTGVACLLAIYGLYKCCFSSRENDVVPKPTNDNRQNKNKSKRK